MSDSSGTLTMNTLATGATLLIWATLSTSPTDTNLPTADNLTFGAPLATGAPLFPWATLSTSAPDTILATGETLPMNTLATGATHLTSETISTRRSETTKNYQRRVYNCYWTFRYKFKLRK